MKLSRDLKKWIALITCYFYGHKHFEKERHTSNYCSKCLRCGDNGFYNYIHLRDELVTPQTAVRLYKNIYDIAGLQTTVEAIIDSISTCGERETIELRNEPSNMGRVLLKRKLPAVTWSGVFDRRTIPMKGYSNLICIDIDFLSHDDIPEIRTNLESDPYTFLCFLSVSGKGLKVVLKVAGGLARHYSNFKCIEKYYLETFNLVIDRSSKDLTRLCLLSYDPNIYVNGKSDAINTDVRYY